MYDERLYTMCGVDRVYAQFVEILVCAAEDGRPHVGAAGGGDGPACC